MNSREKGKRGERQAAKAWAKQMGGQARRGEQYSGGGDSPDIVHGYPNIHLESKYVEQGNPYTWMQQAVEDAGDKVPVVLHRRNRQDWLVILRLDDVQRFVLEAFAGPQVPEVGGVQVPASVPGPGQRSSNGKDG